MLVLRFTVCLASAIMSPGIDEWDELHQDRGNDRSVVGWLSPRPSRPPTEPGDLHPIRRSPHGSWSYLNLTVIQVGVNLGYVPIPVLRVAPAVPLAWAWVAVVNGRLAG